MLNWDKGLVKTARVHKFSPHKISDTWENSTNQSSITHRFTTSGRPNTSIVKQTHVKLDVKTLSSPNLHWETNNSYYKKGKKGQPKTASKPSAYKPKFANTKVSKNFYMKIDSPRISKIQKLSVLKKNISADEINDTEEGVYNLKTPIISSDPKTITKESWSSYLKKCKPMKSRYKYLGKLHKIDL